MARGKQTRGKQSRFAVDRDLALAHSQLAARRAWAADVEGFAELGRAELDSDPLVIFDLNGQPLFYEFTAYRGRRALGGVKAAADKRLGAAVPAIQTGRRNWDPDKGTAAARERAAKLYPKAEIRGTQLVCYSYPKIGVRVDLGGPESGEASAVVFDVADGSEVTRFGDDELEGQTAWSLLDSLSPSRADSGLRRFEVAEKELEAARDRTPRLFDAGFTAKDARVVKGTFMLDSAYKLISFYSSRILPFSPRCNTHTCFELYAQQTNVYCAVATGQMILDWYRYYFDQVDIAAAMGTGPGGTGNAGQVAGYESLSNNGLDATYDTSATWTEAKNEIDAGRPVKSGVPGHARAVAGWKRQNIFLIGQQPKRWLRVYDPWPWNANICAGGAVYWEDWDAITHTNWIYVRHS